MWRVKSENLTGCEWRPEALGEEGLLKGPPDHGTVNLAAPDLAVGQWV